MLMSNIKYFLHFALIKRHMPASECARDRLQLVSPTSISSVTSTAVQYDRSLSLLIYNNDR